MSVFADGTGVTEGTQNCRCGADCEFPCWQRLGLASACRACGCGPLAADDEEPGEGEMPERVSYLVELTFDGETDDDLGVLRMVADDACELVENHWRVEAKVVDGFNRLMAIARQILDEVYPADVFGAADDPDSDESDPGVRLVRALRACDAAMPEPRQPGKELSNG